MLRADSTRRIGLKTGRVTSNAFLSGHHSRKSYLNWERDLVRYFFHVMGGSSPIKDEEGTAFPNTSDAVAHARIIANELAGDDDQYRGYAVVVTDDRDNVIARVPIILPLN
jgi:hypothetical protein